MQSKESENRRKILHEFQKNPTRKPYHIAKELNIPKSTVYDVINRFKETLSTNRRKGGGRKKGFVDKKLVNKVLRSLRDHPEYSDNHRASKYKTSRRTIARIRHAHSFKSYRAKKFPNRTDKQEKSVKLRARRLYDDILTKFSGCVLMDDETYVKLDFSQLPGQKFFAAIHKRNVKPQHKYIFVDKFAKKLMIWQAICQCGLKSSVFIANSTMTKEIYITECLEKRLLPLIKSHSTPVKFWPDLASIHYARATVDWMNHNGIDFVPVSHNPPNCPQFRPIERYWAIVKGILRRTMSRALNATSLKIKWVNAAKKVSKATVQALMGGINRRVRLYLRSSDED